MTIEVKTKDKLLNNLTAYTNKYFSNKSTFNLV
jgi:hypothetical protein